MKNLTQYSQELKANIDNPHVLADLHVECAADYVWLAAQLKPLKEQKSREWIKIKLSGDKPLSDRLTDMKWRSTEVGAKEYAIELKMKCLKEIMQAIKSSNFISSIESKNQI